MIAGTCVGIATLPHSHSDLFFPPLGLASVEAYNPKTNDWVFVAPMNTRRSSVGVGVVDGKHSCISHALLNTRLNLVSALVMKHCFVPYLISSPYSTASKSLAANTNPGPSVSYTCAFIL